MSCSLRPAILRASSFVSRLASERCLDLRHTTPSAFKRIKVGQLPKLRSHSSEPHDLSAACAKRGVFVRAFVTHGQSGPRSAMPDTRVDYQNQLRASVIAITLWTASRKTLRCAFETLV